MKKVTDFLINNAEDSYRDFSSKSAPSVSKENIYGVRVPKIRAFLKELTQDEKNEFIKELPHRYLEENLLHGFILSKIKDFNLALKEMTNFLPYVDNWMVSDTMTPKIFLKHKKDLYLVIKEWVATKHTYTIRFAITCLMDLYLEEYFEANDLKIVSSIKSSEYYVNMAIAWYFATALAKQWDATIPLIESKKLDTWTQNKTIQKAIESYRITEQQKTYLRTLKK